MLHHKGVVIACTGKDINITRMRSGLVEVDGAARDVEAAGRIDIVCGIDVNAPNRVANVRIVERTTPGADPLESSGRIEFE